MYRAQPWGSLYFESHSNTLSHRSVKLFACCGKLDSFFKRKPGHVFIIGSWVELCFLIEYMSMLLLLLICVPCVFVDDVEIVQIAVKKKDGGVPCCVSLALLRRQLLLEALGHLGRRRSGKRERDLDAVVAHV